MNLYIFSPYNIEEMNLQESQALLFNAILT